MPFLLFHGPPGFGDTLTPHKGVFWEEGRAVLPVWEFRGACCKVNPLQL